MTINEAARHAMDGRNEGLRMAVLDWLSANESMTFLSAKPSEQEATVRIALNAWPKEQRALYFDES